MNNDIDVQNKILTVENEYMERKNIEFDEKFKILMENNTLLI